MHTAARIYGLFMVLLLAACGGGGGSAGGGTASSQYNGLTTPAVINSANGSTAGDWIASALVLSNGSAANILYPQSASMPVAPILGNIAARALRHMHKSASGSVMPQDSATVPCANGGSVTINVSLQSYGNGLNGGLAIYGPGSVETNFNSCVENGATTTGSVFLKVVSAGPSIANTIGDIPYNRDEIYTYNMSTSAGNNMQVMSGTLEYIENHTAIQPMFYYANDYKYIDNTSLTLTGIVNYTSKNSDLTDETSSTGEYPGVDGNSIFHQVSGKVYRSDLGYVDVTETGYLTVNSSGTLGQTSGIITATGANGGKIQISAPDATHLLVQMDSDGNGVFEAFQLLALPLTLDAPPTTAPTAAVATYTAMQASGAVAVSAAPSSTNNAVFLQATWTLTKVPAGSQLQGFTQTQAILQFTPDALGDYEASLTVTDGSQTSAPLLVDFSIYQQFSALNGYTPSSSSDAYVSKFYHVHGSNNFYWTPPSVSTPFYRAIFGQTTSSNVVSVTAPDGGYYGRVIGPNGYVYINNSTSLQVYDGNLNALPAIALPAVPASVPSGSEASWTFTSVAPATGSMVYVCASSNVSPFPKGEYLVDASTGTYANAGNPLTTNACMSGSTYQNGNTLISDPISMEAGLAKYDTSTTPWTYVSGISTSADAIWMSGAAGLAVDSNFALYDLTTQRVSSHPDVPKGTSFNSYPIFDADFSNDGRYLLYYSNTDIQLVDLQSNLIVWTFPKPKVTLPANQQFSSCNNACTGQLSPVGGFFDTDGVSIDILASVPGITSTLYFQLRYTIPGQ